MVWRSFAGPGVAAVVVLIAAVVILWAHLVEARRAYKRERLSREEMEAYLRLDTRMVEGSGLRELARRVCDVVAARSPFHRVAMLLRGADGGLYLAEKSGLDVAATAVVERWTVQQKEKEQSGEAAIGGGVAVGARSRVVWLDGGNRAVVVPIRVAGGGMAGILVVFAASVLEVRRQAAEEAVVSLEALGAKLGQAMEDAELTAKLLGVERLMVTEVAWSQLVAPHRSVKRF